MIRTTDIDSLTSFQKNAKSYLAHLEATKDPLVLTVNGKAKIVVQDAAAYQEMLDELERVRFISAIRESEADVAAGRVQDADEAFDDIRRELEI